MKQTEAMTSNSKTVAFFGASTGVGLAALKHTLAAGHQCIALCRTPSKLTAVFPADTTPNLKIVQGDAHDVGSVSKCLQAEDGKFVDVVMSSIGSKPIISKLSIEDPDCCKKGAAILVEALTQLRSNGVTGNPHLIAMSSTGFSRFGRDIPLAMVPLYKALKVPHQDKIIMENRLIESNEVYTIVRASLLTSGESTKEIRVGIEDVKTGREAKAIGYTISREDAGKWIAENMVLKEIARYTNKIVSITY